MLIVTMSVFTKRRLNFPMTVLFAALFSVVGVFTGYQYTANATNMPNAFTKFISDEKNQPASDEQAYDLYGHLSSIESTCGKSSSYSSGAVNGKDGGASYISLIEWSAKGAEDLTNDWRTKSNALIKLLNGEISSGMTLEYNGNTNSEGWCSYIVRMATEVKIPITAKAVEVNDGTATKSANISSIAENCSAEFGEESKSVISLPTEVASFLNELSTSDYNSIVAPRAPAVVGQGGGSTACSELVEALKTQIAAKVAAFCADNSDSEKCGAVAGVADTESSCVVEGVGWIVCPIVKFLAGVTDAVYGIIDNFLNVSVKLFSTDSGSYQAWSAMRNIANVVLVIAFIVIIYSQLTSMGVSNYGIKKMLPRLIVAALLINLSFYVCQLAVDLSNILGGSLKSFLSNLVVFQSAEGNWAQKTLAEGNFFTDTAMAILGAQTGALAIFGAGAAVYFLGIGIFIPVVVAALIAIFITFFILLARLMLIVILIVTAPIAFAAMLLPNTEKWFKWWQKAFIGVLVVYPLIAILFGGAQLAANILVQANPEDLGWTLAAASIAILPLFFTYGLLKGSLNAVPIIGNAAQKLQAKAVGAGRKWSGVGMKKMGERAAAGNSKFAAGVSGAIHGNGRMGRLRQAAAQRAYEEPRMKDLMMQWTKVNPKTNKSTANDAEELSRIALSNPESFEGQAAISLLSSQQDAPSLAKIRKAVRNDPKKLAAYSKAVASNFGALKAKHPEAVQDMDIPDPKTGEIGWDSVKQADMQVMKDGALREGASKSNAFRQTLATAMQDPEQERHFTDGMYKEMGIARPSAVKRAQQAAQPAAAAGGGGGPVAGGVQAGTPGNPQAQAGGGGAGTPAGGAANAAGGANAGGTPAAPAGAGGAAPAAQPTAGGGANPAPAAAQPAAVQTQPGTLTVTHTPTPGGGQTRRATYTPPTPTPVPPPTQPPTNP